MPLLPCWWRWRPAWPRWTCPSRTSPPGIGRTGSSRGRSAPGTPSTPAGPSPRSAPPFAEPRPQLRCGASTCTPPTGWFARKERSARASIAARARLLPPWRRQPRNPPPPGRRPPRAEGGASAARLSRRPLRRLRRRPRLWLRSRRSVPRADGEGADAALPAEAHRTTTTFFHRRPRRRCPHPNRR